MGEARFSDIQQCSGHSHPMNKCHILHNFECLTKSTYKLVSLSSELLYILSAILLKIPPELFLEIFKKIQRAKKAIITHDKAKVLTLPGIKTYSIDTNINR